MIFVLTYTFLFQIPKLALEASPRFAVPDSYNVKAMDVDEAYLVLLMRSAPYVRVLQRGKQLCQWGTTGKGPNEFTHPTDVALNGDEIWVLNKLPNRITIFSLSGDFKTSIALKQLVLAVHLQVVGGIGIVQDGGLYLPTNDLFLIEEGHVEKVLTFDPGKTEEILAPGKPPFTVPSPYAARDLWTFFDDGRLVLNNKGTYRLLFQSPSGREGAPWQLDKQQYNMTQSASDLWLNRYFPQQRNGMGLPMGAWREKAKKVAMPKTYPPAMALIADRNKIWLQRAYGLKDQYWESYREAGKCATLVLPNHLRVYGIYGDGVYVTDQSQDDTPFVVYSMR